jgi:hypothetical protein
MTSRRGALSVNPTTCKISIEKANKIQRRRSRIPNPKLRSVFEIPKNPQGLLFLPRPSSLHAMPHLPPAQHETSKHNSLNEIKIKEKQNETIPDSNSNLAKSMTHHNQTKELTTWFLRFMIRIYKKFFRPKIMLPSLYNTN